MAEFPAINQLIVKLASRCNINCSYCYWFNDPRVLQSPKIIEEPVIHALLPKLQSHIIKYNLKKFKLSFHGGEPTLFPKNKFRSLCESLKSLSQKTGCHFQLSMQSNALLIDDEWMDLLLSYHIDLGISLDGDKQLHDQYRIDMKGRGTYEKTVKAIERIRKSGLNPYILSVANPTSDPIRLINHFVDTLGLKRFDILVPHKHHGHNRESIADFYCKLYDKYQEELIDQDVEIRILDDIMSQVLGRKGSVYGQGYITTTTLLTDGSLEAIDDLRMIDGLTPSKVNIKTHALQDVSQDPWWREIYHSSIHLCSTCKNCDYKATCGGGLGLLVSRWSDTKRFNNVSVYCDDFKEIINHVEQRLAPHIYSKSLETRVGGK